jgi:hypothetical protein
MAVTTHAPRKLRDTLRIHRAAEAASAAGMPAMEAALAQIGAAFNEAAVVNAFKIKVERFIRLGPAHPAVRARFAARAAMLRGRNLAAANILVGRWWRDERKAFQLASAFGCGNRLSLEVLSELRLILRLMRCKRMDAEYSSALTALCDAPMARAAE